jgi:hypothetical protein
LLTISNLSYSVLYIHVDTNFFCFVPLLIVGYTLIVSAHYRFLVLLGLMYLNNG